MRKLKSRFGIPDVRVATVSVGMYILTPAQPGTWHMAASQLQRLLFSSTHRANFLRVVATVEEQSLFAKHIAEVTGMGSSQTSVELRRLEAAGVLEQAPSDSSLRTVVYRRIRPTFWSAVITLLDET
jgi:hypothetical protein